MTWDFSALFDLCVAVAPDWRGIPVGLRVLEACRILGLAVGMGGGIGLLLLVVASCWRKR